MGLVSVTKTALLDAVHSHVERGRLVNADYMDNGDLAYILTDCSLEEVGLYVKLKFQGEADRERMFVLSAHPPRRW